MDLLNAGRSFAYAAYALRIGNRFRVFERIERRYEKGAAESSRIPVAIAQAAPLGLSLESVEQTDATRPAPRMPRLDLAAGRSRLALARSDIGQNHCLPPVTV